MTSKIKVDNINKVSDDSNIINKCSTNITVGANGDTVIIPNGVTEQVQSGGAIQVQSGGSVTIAAGATITNSGTATGFGATGAVNWDTTPKVTGDSPITGASGIGYFLNTSAGVITVNLPAGSAGDIIAMADYAETWDTFNVTVTPNGTDKIGSLNQSATLNTKGQSVTFIYVDGVQGWINTMDSTSNVRGNPPFIVATITGSCNTLATAPDCANTKIATFINPGTLCVTGISPCAANNEVSYMVIGGGGGGGAERGGGGGAGGFREAATPVTPYTASPLDGYPTPGNRITLAANPYPIVIGGGGPAGSYPPYTEGTKGSDTTFSTITGAGGGAGGGARTNPSLPANRPGGSGGGGAHNDLCGSGKTGGSGNQPPTTPPQGNSGGNAGPIPGCGGAGAGGGGAGAVGSTGGRDSAPGGNGGAGVTSEISASPTAYSGGAGGGAWGGPSPGGSSGGSGGGGDGGGPGVGSTTGTINTGGGGGGGAPGSVGSQGGSGIVIIRYKFQ
jgi:hypothetical protein